VCRVCEQCRCSKAGRVCVSYLALSRLLTHVEAVVNRVARSKRSGD